MTPYKYSKYEYKYNYKKCGAIDFLDISHDASLIYDYSTSKIWRQYNRSVLINIQIKFKSTNPWKVLFVYCIMLSLVSRLRSVYMCQNIDAVSNHDL